MLTLFSIPKPFRGHIEVIQKNALASWLQLQPACEVLLLGEEFGIGEAAQEFGVRWLPELKRNAFGTPLLNSAFSLAALAAKHDWLCYVNTDIILPHDFARLPDTARTAKTLFVGQRWDLAITERYDFRAPDAEARLRHELRTRGQLNTPRGIDYFLFRKDSPLTELPPFAVGRPYWDNWFIYRARQLGYAVVDATADAPIIHQKHDYNHLPNKNYMEGPETDENRRLRGSIDRCFSVQYATHVLRNGSIHRALAVRYLWNRLRAFPVLHPRAGWPLAAAREIQRAIKRLLGIKRSEI